MPPDIDPPGAPSPSIYVRVPDGYEGEERRRNNGEYLITLGKIADLAQQTKMYQEDQLRRHDDIERRLKALSHSVDTTSEALEKRLSERSANVLKEMRQVYLDARSTMKAMRWLFAAVTALLGFLSLWWGFFGGYR